MGLTVAMGDGRRCQRCEVLNRDAFKSERRTGRVNLLHESKLRDVGVALPSSLHFLVFRCGRRRRARSSRSELRFPTWMWFYFPLCLSSIPRRADSQPRRRFVVGVKRSLRRGEGQQIFKASPVVLDIVYSQMNYRSRLQLKIRILCKQLTLGGGNKHPVSSLCVKYKINWFKTSIWTTSPWRHAGDCW